MFSQLIIDWSVFHQTESVGPQDSGDSWELKFDYDL